MKQFCHPAAVLLLMQGMGDDRGSRGLEHRGVEAISQQHKGRHDRMAESLGEWKDRSPKSIAMAPPHLAIVHFASHSTSTKTSLLPIITRITYSDRRDVCDFHFFPTIFPSSHHVCDGVALDNLPQFF